MSSFLIPETDGVVMDHFVQVSTPVALFFGVLLFVGGGGQFANAQAPVFEVGAPVESLEQASTASDSQLVHLATALIEARSYAKISHSEYKAGVWYFLTHHPDFYGNFFGDPFYATYNTRYFRLVRMRWLAELEVDPHGEGGIITSFFCDPLSYDPAYDGCEGLRYTPEEYFLVPLTVRASDSGPFMSRSFPTLRHAFDARDVERAGVPDSRKVPRDVSPPERTARTIRAGVNPSGPPLEVARIRPILGVDSIASGLRVPDEFARSLQESASALRQREISLHIQELMRRQYGRSDLSARERAEFAHGLAKGLSSKKGDFLPTLRSMSRDPARIPGDFLQQKRDEIQRRIDRGVSSVRPGAGANVSTSNTRSSDSHSRTGRTQGASTQSVGSEDSGDRP